MAVRSSKYGPRRINRYTPAMAYHAGLVHAAPFEVDFGAPAVASATAIVNAVTVTGGVTITTFLTDNVDPVVAATSVEFPYGPGFGRALQIVFSAAGTPAVNFFGRDYLGQPMRETLTGNGTTPVLGNKAFKWLDQITVASGVTGTINVGTQNRLGLPFCMSNVISEQLDGVRVATLGTLVTPSRVDPQTAITNDPRGVYTPNSTLNGTARLKAVFLPDPSLNANDRGGLHGLQHFFA